MGLNELTTEPDEEHIREDSMTKVPLENRAMASRRRRIRQHSILGRSLPVSPHSLVNAVSIEQLGSNEDGDDELEGQLDAPLVAPDAAPRILF